MGATCFVQPFDVVKNQLQVSSKGSNSFVALADIFKREGVSGIYRGLSAGLLRQATYTTTRLGVYNSVLNKALEYNDNKPISFMAKMGIGMFSGGVGSIIGTPADISLIRMSTDSRLPEAQRRNYKNVFNAISRIVKEEGVLTLWRGATPTVLRAMILNAAQLSSYTEAKEQLIKAKLFQEGVNLHITASMISGLFSTIVSMPVDIVKTRLQNMTSTTESRNVFDIGAKIIKNEGFFSLWRGFAAYYLRLGPHTVITFLMLERLNSLYKTYA